MDKRAAHDSDSGASASAALATPRASGEPALVSPRSEAPESAAVSEPSDTLLSAGKPADKLELVFEDQLEGIDQRLRELDARVAVLERKKTSSASDPRQKPWLWIAFLIALVVVFQLLHRVR